MASPAASIGGSIIQAQKSKYPAKYITLDDSGDKSKRNPDGTMNYLPETKHGIALDYSIFGNSAEGVDLNDITEKIVAHSGKSASLGSMSKGITTPRKTNFKRARRISRNSVMASNTGIAPKASVAVAVVTPKKALPFNFMPDTGIAPKASVAVAVVTPKKALPFNFMPDGASSSSRNGSSSLLNKSLGSGSSSSSKSKAKQTMGMAIASGSVAFKVAAFGPLPANGWGNMFASKLVGEWKCDGCYIMNPPDGEECQVAISREERRGVNRVRFASKLVGEWKCDGCYIMNPPDGEECLSCNLPRGAKGCKPGEGKDKSIKSSGPPAGFESSNAGAWNSSSSSTGTSTGAFTFAAPATDTAAVTGDPVSTGGFTFGAPQTTTDDKKKDDAHASGGGFTFGAQAPEAATEKKD
eukprot:CAMPEP_0194126076 /NCGR_PEP_ID=MMETSP0150-20130528/59799_1 /TAXON_ID=122233 /ORGANISM="Chaetoceros debilis, Strain MM31A-1" /LENGTH=410 /DNA_ID=CAMNT_0038819919 /DNA_START=171 /DNA_END=1404 /DNA_ORIENTATION=-